MIIIIDNKNKHEAFSRVGDDNCIINLCVKVPYIPIKIIIKIRPLQNCEYLVGSLG